MADNSIESVITDSVLIKSIISYLDNSVPCEEKDVKILKKTINVATNPGDNYISVVYQAEVFYSIADDPTEFAIHFIIKCIQPNEHFTTLLKESKVFEKERLMYETVLPAIESISGIHFAPKCFYVQEEPNKLIVLSDLKQLGYSMCDRKLGLDLAHCKIVIERMAIFHASSMKFSEENKDLLGNFSTGMSTDPILVDLVYRSNLEKLIETVEKWNEPEFVDVLPKLNEILSNYKDVYKLPMDTSTDEFWVICHGDAWCNNFMFAYDEEDGMPTDVMFLDHQMPFYSSPGYDLNYFLISSPNLETRFNHEKELLSLYKTAFNKQLEELDHSFQLSTEKLQRAYKGKAIYGFTMMLTILPLIFRNVEAAGDSEDIQTNFRNMQNALFANEDFIAILKFNLRKWQRINLFDNLIK